MPPRSSEPFFDAHNLEPSHLNPVTAAVMEVLSEEVLGDFGVTVVEAQRYKVFSFSQDGEKAYLSDMAMQIVVHHNGPDYAGGPEELVFEVRLRSNPEHEVFGGDKFHKVWLETRMRSDDSIKWQFEPMISIWRNDAALEPWEIAPKIRSYAKGQRQRKAAAGNQLTMYFGESAGT